MPFDTTDTKDLLEFLDDEIDVRRQSAEPSPTDDEAKGIAEAEWAKYVTICLIAERDALKLALTRATEGGAR